MVKEFKKLFFYSFMIFLIMGGLCFLDFSLCQEKTSWDKNICTEVEKIEQVAKFLDQMMTEADALPEASAFNRDMISLFEKRTARPYPDGVVYFKNSKNSYTLVIRISPRNSLAYSHGKDGDGSFIFNTEGGGAVSLNFKSMQWGYK